jgi:hypothetical protein
MSIIWKDHTPGKLRLHEAIESHRKHRNLKRFERDVEAAASTLEVNRKVLGEQLVRLVRARNHARAQKLVVVIPDRAVRKWVYITVMALVAVIFILGSLRGIARI